MRAPLAAALLLAGCGAAQNPCSGQAPLCLVVEAEGAFEGLDQLDGVISGENQPALHGRESDARPFNLPVRFAAELPASVSGALTVELVASRGGQTVAYGRGSVTVPPSGQTVVVSLAPLFTDGDGGGPGDLGRFQIGDDLANPPDAGSSPNDLAAGDLAGEIATPGDLSTAPPAMDAATTTPGHWTKLNNSASAFFLLGVWGTGSGQVFVGGSDSSHAGVILSSTDHGQTWVEPGPVKKSIWAIWGTGQDRFAVGDNTYIIHSTDDFVTFDTLSSASGTTIAGIWGDGLGNIYCPTLDGDWEISSMDGGMSFSGGLFANGKNAQLFGVWGIGNDDVYVVGTAGTIFDRDGNLLDGGVTTELDGVWGSSANDVYVAGAQGVILHRANRGAFTRLTTNFTSHLASIWGSGPNDIYVAGDGGVIRHSADQGQTWVAQDSGTTEDLSMIWGSGPNDVYVVGNHGTILHYP
jgi:photosystem II stability/assembly factor-like uncharacterized protein